jgi:hypothetical protein
VTTEVLMTNTRNNETFSGDIFINSALSRTFSSLSLLPSSGNLWDST